MTSRKLLFKALTVTLTELQCTFSPCSPRVLSKAQEVNRETSTEPVSFPRLSRTWQSYWENATASHQPVQQCCPEIEPVCHRHRAGGYRNSIWMVLRNMDNATLRETVDSFGKYFSDVLPYCKAFDYRLVFLGKQGLHNHKGCVPYPAAFVIHYYISIKFIWNWQSCKSHENTWWDRQERLLSWLSRINSTLQPFLHTARRSLIYQRSQLWKQILKNTDSLALLHVEQTELQTRTAEAGSSFALCFPLAKGNCTAAATEHGQLFVAAN